MNSPVRWISRLLSVAFLMVPPLHAQWSLRVDSVDASAFPTIRLLVTTRFGQLLRKDLAASNYTVVEDGESAGPIAYFGTQGSTPFDIGILMAGGSTASAQDITIMKGIADKFIDSLDGLNDQCALITYSTNSLVIAPMQTSKMLLRNALEGFTSGSGSNRLWDGLYNALTYTAFNSVNPSRAMFLMSNGFDDGSTKTINDIVSYARQMNIPIHTLGVSAGGAAVLLEELARNTGGLYFTSPDLAVETVVNSLRGTPDYCLLEYPTPSLCRDGQTRSLSVRLRVGNDSTQTVSAYTPSADPSTYVAAAFAVDTGSAVSGKEATLGLRIETPVQKQPFRPVAIRLAFDPALIKLTGVRTDTTMLPHSAVSFTETPTGADITVTGTSLLDRSGKLLTLVFSTSDVSSNTDVPIRLIAMTFSGGCLDPRLRDGRLRILPRTRAIACTGGVHTFVWNESTKTYDPHPAEFSVEVTNTGDLPVTGLTATLPAVEALKPAWGRPLSTPVKPDSLAPGAKGTAKWLMKAVPRADEIAVPLDAVVTSAEGVHGTGRIFVNIKPATSAAVMQCSIDTVCVSGGTYTPRPAAVTALVRSAGTQDSPAGVVDIVLPSSITLASGSATQSFPVLASGSDQRLRWEIDYPTDRPSMEMYDILLVMSGTGAPNDTASVRLVVPPLSGPVLDASCLAHAERIAYDTTARVYPPVRLTARVRNGGNGPSGVLKAELIIVPGDPVVLHPGETFLKVVSPGLPPADSTEVSWNLNILRRSCEDDTIRFAYVLTESDTVVYACSTFVVAEARPNLPPEMTHREPDMLDSLDADTPCRFHVAVIDADRDVPAYRWTVDGNPACDDADSCVQSFASPGEHTVRCVVTDSCGASVETAWTFTVRATSGFYAHSPSSAPLSLSNAPNPFTDETVIRFTLPEGSRGAVLEVMDICGRLVGEPVRIRGEEGTHETVFRAGTLPAGCYFARLRVPGSVIVRPLLLLR
ncbi:MAG: VWA domain-containing protein [Bacteroidota bacterium]|nr:VWA domain-containing protein [Bacteroidota bacterium]